MTSRATNYAEALIDTWSAAEGKKREDVLDRFITIIRSDHAEPFVSSIVVNIERLATERERRRTVKAELTRRPTSQERQAFERAGVTMFEETSAILGGFKLKSEGRAIDASIRGGLSEVRRILTSD